MMSGEIQRDRSLIIEPITLDGFISGLNFPGTPLAHPEGNASAEVSLSSSFVDKDVSLWSYPAAAGTTDTSSSLKKMFAVHLLAFHFTKLKEDQIKKVCKREP